MARRGPAGPAALGRMARATRLPGAAPRALLLPLLLLLLMLSLPPLLARALRPPVSARRRPAAPCPGGAGHAGWAQRLSWTHGYARGTLEPSVIQNALWVRGRDR